MTVPGLGHRDSTPAASPSLRRSALYWAMITVMALVAIEVLVRLAGSIVDDARRSRADDQSRVAMEASRDLGWQLRRGYRGKMGNEPRRTDAAGLFDLDSAQAADSTTPIVLVIGGSLTFGWGVPAESTYVEVIDTLVPGIHAINLGTPGYSAFQGLVVARRELARRHPVLLVVEYGYNDRRGVLPGDFDRAPRFAKLFDESRSVSRALVGLLDWWRTLDALRTMLRWTGILGPGPNRLSVAELVPRVNEEQFRRNLTGIAALARKHGVPLLIVTVSDEPIASQLLSEGLRYAAAGDYAKGIAYLRAAVASRNEFSQLAQLQLAGLLRATGDMRGASDALRPVDDSIEFDGANLVRFDTTYARVAREVAASESVTAFFTDSLFADHGEEFSGDGHLNVAGHRRLGVELAQRVNAMLHPDPSAVPDRPAMRSTHPGSTRR